MIRLFVYLSILPLSPAIICKQYIKSTNKTTTCNGDYCVLYKSDHFGTEETDCMTGLILDIGCITDPKLGTMCICDKDNCNKDYKIMDTSRPEPYVECYSYQTNQGMHPLDIIKITEDAVQCTINAKELYVNGLYGWSKEFYGSSDYSPDIFPFVMHGSVFTLYYMNGLYAYQTVSNYWNYYGRCNTKLCNEDFNFKSVWKHGVKCHTEFDEDCEGQFCMLHIENFPYISDGKEMAHVGIIQGCFSANESNAAHQITVGIYKYQHITTYLCQQDFCNINETTAKKSVEDWRENPVTLAVPKDHWADDQSLHINLLSLFLLMLSSAIIIF